MATQAQDHIHLDTDLEGAPENSPTNKYTALVPEARQTKAHVALEWAVDSTLMAHKVTSGGDPQVSQARRYKLVVTRAELDVLIADLGHLCYFVPHYHPDDAEDHTGSRSQVQFVSLSEIQSKIHADLSEYYCVIQLQIS